MSNIIPFDSREGTIWYNGKLAPWQDCKIHILNHGLHYGSSFFEGIRVYNRIPFKLHEHFLRFYESARIMGIIIPYNIEELERATIEQINLNNIEFGYIRPIAWRGCESMLISAEGTKTHVAIAVWSSFESNRLEKKQKGMNLCISHSKKPSKDSFTIHAKNAGIYTLSTIVKNDAASKGYDDALMLDSEGNIAEATTSNFFAIIKDEVFTPTEDNCLKGITRETVIDICYEYGIKLNMTKIKASELKNFDAAFLTGTAIEIMPISAIENKQLDLTHPIMRLLINKFEELTKYTLKAA